MVGPLARAETASSHKRLCSAHETAVLGARNGRALGGDRNEGVLPFRVARGLNVQAA